MRKRSLCARVWLLRRWWVTNVAGLDKFFIPLILETFQPNQFRHKGAISFIKFQMVTEFSILQDFKTIGTEDRRKNLLKNYELVQAWMPGKLLPTKITFSILFARPGSYVKKQVHGDKQC